MSKPSGDSSRACRYQTWLLMMDDYSTEASPDFASWVSRLQSKIYLATGFSSRLRETTGWSGLAPGRRTNTRSQHRQACMITVRDQEDALVRGREGASSPQARVLPDQDAHHAPYPTHHGFSADVLIFKHLDHGFQAICGRCRDSRPVQTLINLHRADLLPFFPQPPLHQLDPVAKGLHTGAGGP